MSFHSIRLDQLKKERWIVETIVVHRTGCLPPRRSTWSNSKWHVQKSIQFMTLRLGWRTTQSHAPLFFNACIVLSAESLLFNRSTDRVLRNGNFRRERSEMDDPRTRNIHSRFLYSTCSHIFVSAALFNSETAHSLCVHCWSSCSDLEIEIQR